MPRYFFDIDDGKRQVHDRVGMEFLGADGALREAISLLHSLAEVRRFEKRTGTTIVEVRDAQGNEVYTGATHPEN